jgi:cyclohexanone monooxygenase
MGTDMICEPTQTPDDVDIQTLREKYRQEREKRLTRAGRDQYVEPAGDLADNYEADPHMPVVPRAPISEEIDVAILGAGFSGMLAAVHLRKAGVESLRNIDHAGDFGGCWYWNRYPGIQCDNDAYCYLPLLEETGYMPTAKFVDGSEIYEHCQRIAKRYRLYDGALFHTLVEGLRWDEALKRWRISTNRGDDIRARFVVMASGPLNKPKLPGVPGLRDFKGRKFHTARWDYAYTGGGPTDPVLDKLADKRVAIVGTGATAVQVAPFLGRYAKQVYVIQRTPSSVDARGNAPTDPAWVRTLKPGWQKARQANFHHAAWEQRLAPGEPDMVCDIWTELSRNLQVKLAAQGWPEVSLEQYMDLREVEDYRVMERLRRRVDDIVKDPITAEALKPYYRFLCKRPCSNDDYYETFNRPNVKLIDVSGTRGLEAMTETGFVHQGACYEVDCIIFASGFEVTSDLRRRWGIATIEGRGGASIYDHWAGGLKTLHGMMTRGFPNQFFTGFTQAGVSANNTATFDQQGEHIAYVIAQALARGAETVEPSQSAQDAWVRTIHETAVDNSKFQAECTPSYFNDEGGREDAAGRRTYKSIFGEPYGPGFYAFGDLLQAWRARGDLDGLVVERPGAPAPVLETVA